MGAYSDEVLTHSPVAYWRLGETSGTNAADSSGNSLDATYEGGFTLGAQGIAPDGNRAVSLDATNGTHVDIGVPAALRPGLGDMSWIIWYRSTTTDASGLYREGSDAERAEIFLNMFGNLNRVGVIVRSSGGNINSNAVIAGATDGDWHMVAAVADRDADLELYFDGSLASNVDMSSISAEDLDATSAVSGIGSINGITTSNLNGTVTEVAVFASVLTSINISDLYAVAVDRPRMLPLGGVG